MSTVFILKQLEDVVRLGVLTSEGVVKALVATALKATSVAERITHWHNGGIVKLL